MTPDNIILTSFKNWDEIFSDPAEADRQYSELVTELRAEYSGNRSLLKERVEVNPTTGLRVTVFERTFGTQTRIERLPGGDVRYEFAYLAEVHTIEVVPQAGNKRHDWTYDEIVGLQAQAAAAIAKSSDPGDRLSLSIVLSKILGKPATIGWEETMLRNNKLPQRVGFKIYPDDILRLAKDKMKR